MIVTRIEKSFFLVEIQHLYAVSYYLKNLLYQGCKFSLETRRIFSHSPAHNLSSPAYDSCPCFFYYFCRYHLKSLSIRQLKLGFCLTNKKIDKTLIYSFETSFGPGRLDAKKVFLDTRHSREKSPRHQTSVNIFSGRKSCYCLAYK